MLQGLKKAINLIRLIPTVLTCAMLVFYATYLGLNIKNGIGDKNVNVVFLIVTVISLVIQILLYFRVISSGTSRKLKRACRVTKILTNILALFVALYTSSVASSFMSILMLPVWFAQLIVEIISGVIERIIGGTLGRFKR